MSGATQPHPACEEFGSALQECIKGHRMFVAALQELEGQLGSLGVGSPTSAKKQSPLMQRVAAAAPSPRLESYLAGKGPQQPPQRRLAELIDDNLQLLQLLAQEQRDLLRGMQGHFEAAGAVAREDAALVEPSLLMAALLDGLQQEVEMLVRVADTVALDTEPEQLSSYETLLGLEPFLSTAIVEECLSWAAPPGPSTQRRRSSGTAG